MQENISNSPELNEIHNIIDNQSIDNHGTKRTSEFSTSPSKIQKSNRPSASIHSEREDVMDCFSGIN